MNIVEIKNRVNTMHILKEKENFSEIQKVISRVIKLANNGNLETSIFSSKNLINSELFEKDCEKKVFEFINKLEKLISSSSNLNYFKLFNLFEDNTYYLNQLFDKDKGIMVMADNPDIRNNRLNLLGLVRNYSLKIADFTLVNS